MEFNQNIKIYNKDKGGNLKGRKPSINDIKKKHFAD
jgi:hypothetical protein